MPSAPEESHGVPFGFLQLVPYSALSQIAIIEPAYETTRILKPILPNFDDASNIISVFSERVRA